MKDQHPAEISPAPPVEELTSAVLEVLKRLPAPENRRLKKAEVLALAIERVPESQRQGAKPLLRRLVACSPSKYGRSRSNPWWKIVLGSLDKACALEAYLGQFPNSLTPSQHTELRAEIKLRFGLNDVEAIEQLKRFKSHEPRLRPAEQDEGYARGFVSESCADATSP